MKLKVWLDSGANINSCNEQIIDIESELGLSIEEWKGLPDSEKESYAREIAFDQADWGYEVIP